MLNRPTDCRQTLTWFFLISYLTVLYIAADSVGFTTSYHAGFLTFVFTCLALITYSLLYLLPAMVITWLMRAIFKQKPAVSYVAAILTTGITLLLFYANAKLFSLYGMFINGFIINLLMTPGGVASLGGSGASDVGFALIAVGFFVLPAAFLFLSKWLAKQIGIPNIHYKIALPLLIFLFVGIQMTYAGSEATNKVAVLAAAESVPFFQPVTARHFFKKIGFNVTRDHQLNLQGNLSYPKHPLKFAAPKKPYNIVWLAAESWRADTLNPEIMPATDAFANEALRFNDNYSGGNGTRNGIFSMFMGIPGSYWFPFIKARRGAAIIDVLQQQHYQMNFYTSAKFSYPEFDQTIFAQVPPELLHSRDTGGQGWERDRANVKDLLNFIEKRDPAKPFFTFMFFESPHARYYFPPESVIKTPYRDDINYATLNKEDLRNEIVPIKNRYLNAVHHLDSQFARIFTYLKEKNLLDSTIVILLGDHGEEFMEHGYWGHNSTFVNEQIRTPLVIWMPGQQPKIINTMSSHMDIVPTIMPLLGVNNPMSDYAIGYNLLADKPREHTYISDWSRIAYIDKDVKIVQPVTIGGAGRTPTTTADDKPLDAEKSATLMQSKQPAMLQLVKDLSHFLDKKAQ